MSENTCPTCEATGSDPCVTASGKPAKVPHKNRVTVQPESVGNDVSFNDVNRKIDPNEGTTFRKVPNRADRRAQGRHKSVRNGFRNRNVRRTVNDSIRRFWHPVKKDSDTDVNESASV